MAEGSKPSERALKELRGVRCAVTGASGFLGQALTCELEAMGADVIRFERRGSSAPGIVVGDLSNSDALSRLVRGADVVFHVAGLAHRRPQTVSEERAFFEVNSAGTERLLSKCEHSSRVIYVSSSSVYGPGGPFKEGDALSPRTAYGKSKELAEEHVLARSNTWVVRPSMFFGRGAPGNLAKLAALVTRGVYPLVDGGRARKSICHVSMVVRALTWIAVRAPDTRVLNVSDATPYEMREIAEAIAQGIGRSVRGVPVPAGPLRLIGRALGGRVKQTVAAFTDDAMLDTSALHAQLPEVGTTALDALRRGDSQ